MLLRSTLMKKHLFVPDASTVFGRTPTTADLLLLIDAVLTISNDFTRDLSVLYGLTPDEVIQMHSLLSRCLQSWISRQHHGTLTNLRESLGKRLEIISDISEYQSFQARGAVHFHVLYWGLQRERIENEIPSLQQKKILGMWAKLNEERVLFKISGHTDMLIVFPRTEARSWLVTLQNICPKHCSMSVSSENGLTIVQATFTVRTLTRLIRLLTIQK